MDQLIFAIDHASGLAVFLAGLILVVLQLSWLTVPRGKDATAGGGSGDDPRTPLQELDRLTCIWLTAELCGVIAVFSGFPYSACLALTLAVGGACSAPTYFRLGVRIAGATSGCRALLATPRVIGRAIAVAAAALYKFVNRPESLADRTVRRMLLSAIAACLVLLVARQLTDTPQLAMLKMLPVQLALLMSVGVVQGGEDEADTREPVPEGPRWIGQL